MFSKLNMLQKGLLLVGVPLLFEVVFVVYLIKMLDKAELDVDRATNAKVAASASNRILTLFYESGTLLVAYRSGRNELVLEKFKDVVNNIPSQLQLLQGALEKQKDGPERYRRAELLCHRAMDLLDRAEHRAELGAAAFPYDSAIPLGTQLDVMSKELIAEMSSLVKEYQSTNLSIEAALASRAQLRVFIFAGTVLSILLALLLAGMFTRGTVRRLSSLMKNTELLARNEEMPPLLSGTDEIAKLDQVLHDVSEKLAAAEAERKAIEQLKRDFLNMITHDLRAPLTSVSTAIEVLQEGMFGELTAQGRRSLAFTNESVNYMARLIDDLLDSERIESGQLPLDKSSQDLYAIAAAAVSAIQNLLESRQIQIELGECSAEVFADETRLQQVFGNLLHNALKYSPPGGRITISFEHPDSSTVEVRVSDEGTGVAEHLHESIFDRFRQAHITDATEKRGSGLGLYFCKQVIALHGGTIGVLNNPTGGSTFWFRLPLYCGGSPM